MKNKPAQPKHGISYAVEKGENIDAKTGKKNKGDIFKKYNNGVLKEQVFVPKNQVQKNVQEHVQKHSMHGGKTGKIRIKNKEKRNSTAKKTKIIYIQAPPAVQAQAQAPPQSTETAPVVVQDGTTFGQAVKTGVASGFGFAIGAEVVGAVADAF